MWNHFPVWRLFLDVTMVFYTALKMLYKTADQDDYHYLVFIFLTAIVDIIIALLQKGNSE